MRTRNLCFHTPVYAQIDEAGCQPGDLWHGHQTARPCARHGACQTYVPAHLSVNLPSQRAVRDLRAAGFCRRLCKSEILQAHNGRQSGHPPSIHSRGMRCRSGGVACSFPCARVHVRACVRRACRRVPRATARRLLRSGWNKVAMSRGSRAHLQNKTALETPCVSVARRNTWQNKTHPPISKRHSGRRGPGAPG